MPEKRHLNGASLAGRGWPAYDRIWIISPLTNYKKRCQSWTHSDKNFWIRACLVRVLIYVETVYAGSEGTGASSTYFTEGRMNLPQEGISPKGLFFEGFHTSIPV